MNKENIDNDKKREKLKISNKKKNIGISFHDTYCIDNNENILRIYAGEDRVLFENLKKNKELVNDYRLGGLELIAKHITDMAFYCKVKIDANSYNHINKVFERFKDINSFNRKYSVKFRSIDELIGCFKGRVLHTGLPRNKWFVFVK